MVKEREVECRAKAGTMQNISGSERLIMQTEEVENQKETKWGEEEKEKQIKKETKEKKKTEKAPPPPKKNPPPPKKKKLS